MHRFVPTRETCIKLKQAGMPQEGDWFWLENIDGGAVYVKQRMFMNPWERIIARAPLTDELLKTPAIKEFLHDWLEGEDSPDDPAIWVGKAIKRAGFTRVLMDDNIPESLAQLCLELVKEGVGLW